MLRALLAAVLALAAFDAAADGAASNATELRDALRGSARPARLEPIALERGCGPAGCSVDVGRLAIRREPGGIERARGGRVRLEAHKPRDGRDLPDMDWDPLDAYRVFSGGRRWGTCIDFTHTGIGRSGVHQRWTSVVLVPWRGGAPAEVAHRFVGYWAGCDNLAAGARGEVVLPVVEPDAAGGANPLRIVRYRCTAERCTALDDPRVVAGDPAGETGALVVGGK